MSTFAILRYQRIWTIGCLACRQLGFFRPCEAHHLTGGGHAGQKRRGDMETIGLCEWHHRGKVPFGMALSQCRETYGPSYALESRKFRERFGSDDELLAEQNRLIEHDESKVVGKVPA